MIEVLVYIVKEVHKVIYDTAQFKLYIYTCVTRDFLDKFLVSLASYTQVNH